jgi:hypothetical protein
LSMLGQVDRSIRKTVVAKHAHSIRMAYFDNTKTLTDSIPSVLLVHLDREETETRPTDPMIRYLQDNGHASGSV